MWATPGGQKQSHGSLIASLEQGHPATRVQSGHHDQRGVATWPPPKTRHLDDSSQSGSYQRLPRFPPRSYPPPLEDRWAEKQSEQYTGLSPLGWKGT